MADTEKTVADDAKEVPTEPTLSIDELDTVAGGTLHAEFRRAPEKNCPKDRGAVLKEPGVFGARFFYGILRAVRK